MTGAGELAGAPAAATEVAPTDGEAVPEKTGEEPDRIGGLISSDLGGIEEGAGIGA